MYLKKIKYLLFLFPVLFVSCSGVQSYYSKLETFMTKEKYIDAQALVDKSEKIYGKKNKLLYYLDLGLTLHLAKNYQQSNDAFEQAKQTYSLNYTESISAGIFSLFSNDNVIPYYGQPYEMAYANIFCALNYILDGQDNEAVVEARQVDNLFKKIKADSNGKAYYKDDGFVRYFMGLVYENAGYYNDALISYKLALKNYGANKDYAVDVPDDLICSLYTMYYKLGMSSQAEELKSQYPNVKLIKSSANTGEVIIVNYNGLSPKKVDNILEFSFYNAWPYFVSTAASSPEQEKVEQVFSAVRAGIANDFIKVAFPKYVRYENEITCFNVEKCLTDEKLINISTSYLADDVASIMEGVLASKNTAVYAKTIARSVARYALTKVVSNQVRQQEKKGDHTLSILTNSILNITSSLIEKSDKRSWRTLPEKINMARFVLPVGIHKLKINYMGNYKNVVVTEQIEVVVTSDKKTFVVLNSFKPIK